MDKEQLELHIKNWFHNFVLPAVTDIQAAVQVYEEMLSLISSSEPAEVGGWVPTPKNINALPEPIRKYVHDIETLCDPAGIIAENTIAKDIISAQEKQITADQEALIAAEQFAGEMIPLLKAVNKIDGGEAEAGDDKLRDNCFKALACLYIELGQQVADDVNTKVKAYISSLLRQPRTVSREQVRDLVHRLWIQDAPSELKSEFCNILSELGYTIEEPKEE